MWCTAHALLSNPFEQKPQTATPVLTGSEEKLLSGTGVPGDTGLSGSSAGPALSAAEALRPESGRSASSTGVAAPAAADPKAPAERGPWELLRFTLPTLGVWIVNPCAASRAPGAGA